MASCDIRTWLLWLALPDANHPTPNGLPPQSTADLTQLCELAQHHGVLPSVMVNLEKLEHAPVSQVLTAFKERLVAPTMLTLMLRLREEEIRQVFKRHAVNAVVLRGPEFADRLYPEPGLRLFTDLDILVSRDAWANAGAALREIGYQSLSSALLKHTAPYGEQSWKHPEHRLEHIELHWNLVNSPALQRSVSVELDDLQLEPTTHRLTAAALLVIAAVHGATSHSFDRLQILCDVRQIACGVAGDVDEKYLVEVCRQTGSTLAVTTALGLAERTFDDAACRRLQRCFPHGLRHQVAHSLLTPRAVIFSDSKLNGLRRRLFRELLKRQ